MHYTNVSSSWHLVKWIDDLFEIDFSSTSSKRKDTPTPQSQIGSCMKLIIIWGIIEQLEKYFILENIVFQNTI